MLDVRPSRAEIEPVALDVIRRRGAEVLSIARRYAASMEDAEDAYQRALEILLTKAPSVDEDVLVPWLKVVVKHEAYALRRTRARDVPASHGTLDALPGDVGNADDCAERIDRMRAGSEALQRLKPQETRCMVLLAQGYTYSQIQELTGYSYTKVNRSLSEGRKAFFARVQGIESGQECERMAPLLSALADGEASVADVTTLRPHLRGCAACRATLRDYREAPGRVALGLGPLGIAAATAGGHGGGWLTAIWLKLQGLFASKAAVVAASTVVVAGGGMATVHEMTAPAPARGTAAVQHAPASPPAARATTAPRSSLVLASARASRPAKKTRQRHDPKPKVPQPTAPTTTTSASAPSASAPSAPSAHVDPPATVSPPDPGGEFGP